MIADASNFYTKGETDEIIEELKLSGCCITPEDVDEKIEEAISGISVSGVTEEEMNNAIASAKTEIESEIPDISDYVRYEDLPDINNYATKQWVINQNYATNSELIQYVTNLQNQIDSLKAQISGCCGSQSGETITRWITMTGESDYYCSGTTKLSKEKEQSSSDGINWTDTGNYRTGDTVLGENSEDCGYTPPTTKKVTLHYINGTSYERECNGSTRLMLGDIAERQLVSSATVGDCVESIGVSSFADCANLKSVSLPTGLTTIESTAFEGCSGITSVTVPDSVTYIGTRAFGDCTGMTSVTLPSGLTTIENSLLTNCSSLDDIDIPDSVTSIGTSGLSHCTSLVSVDIPSGVTFIGSHAFDSCTSLTGVTIHAVNPPSIGESVFRNTNLCPLYVPSESLEEYKSSWSNYISRLQAIQ